MKPAWLHRCAILLAVLALIVIALGALLTGEICTLPGAAIWASSLAGWIALAAVIAHLLSTGVMHVVNGALTLAADVVFAMQMRRSLIQLPGALTC